LDYHLRALYNCATHLTISIWHNPVHESQELNHHDPIG
jgi:hypothetical protein